MQKPLAEHALSTFFGTIQVHARTFGGRKRSPERTKGNAQNSSGTCFLHFRGGPLGTRASFRIPKRVPHGQRESAKNNLARNQPLCTFLGARLGPHTGIRRPKKENRGQQESAHGNHFRSTFCSFLGGPLGTPASFLSPNNVPKGQHERAQNNIFGNHPLCTF